MEGGDPEKAHPSAHMVASDAHSTANDKEGSGASDDAMSIHSCETVPEARGPDRPKPPQSIASSITPPAVKVRRADRRGLFGRFTVLAEVEEPKHYGRRTKWGITFIIALAAAAAPLGSAIFFRTPRFAASLLHF